MPLDANHQQTKALSAGQKGGPDRNGDAVKEATPRASADAKFLTHNPGPGEGDATRDSTTKGQH